MTALPWFLYKHLRMKSIIASVVLLLLGCSSKAQQKKADTNGFNIEIQEGVLISIGDINFEKFEIGLEDLEVLEDFGIDLDSLNINHLLCYAIDQCDIELLNYLIDKGADVDTKCDGDDAITYLAYCTEEGVAMTKTMIEHGADKNGADQDNGSYLSYAISYDNHQLVKYLVEIGVDRKQKDINQNMGCLPIHGCTSLEMLKSLITEGFEINAICDNGRNLLHFAAKDNLIEVAQYLVENNLVALDLKDKNGETPLDYAMRFGNPEIGNIIRKGK
ncbi:MAG: ankyrin repeat domain-containing protein [Saprospiraceae bacterium]|nr:ankyrin repeat domain-containing protein [Saprospiraceae bacterium]